MRQTGDRTICLKCTRAEHIGTGQDFIVCDQLVTNNKVLFSAPLELQGVFEMTIFRVSKKTCPEIAGLSALNDKRVLSSAMGARNGGLPC